MKKRSLSSILFLLLCVVSAKAQIQNSSGSEEYWYYLLSAKSGVESQAIAENADAETAAAFPLATVMLNEEDEGQQWKFVKDENTGNLLIVNRKSGKKIVARSVAQGAVNATQLGTDTEHKGHFRVDEIADGQFTISGVEEDNIRRYLALHDLKASDIPVLDKANLQNSAFAWVAVQAGQGIHNVEGNVTIKVKNSRIIVENAKNYKVTNLAGVQFPKRAVLEQGVYVVTVGNTSTNVYVK